MSAVQATSPMPAATSRAFSIASSGGDEASGRGSRVRHRPECAAGHARHRAHRAGQPVRGELGARGLGLRHPRLGAVARAVPLGRQVEEHGREVDAGDAVDHRVVRLGDQREPPVLEALDEPQLPQRLRAVQALGEHARAHGEQRVLVAGRGQRRVAHVVGEVERRVVDPQRAAGLERRRRELLAVARDEVQPRLDVREELLQPGRLALEQREGADVHVRVRLLLRQERGIDRRQPVEMLLGGHGPIVSLP